jgi:hypothetical protein
MDEERRLLERLEEPMLAMQLHTHLGTSSMVRGALRQAQEHHARVLALYNPQWHGELVLRFGVDPAVLAGVILGWSLWLAGWPDQARARMPLSSPLLTRRGSTSGAVNSLMQSGLRRKVRI